MRCDDCRTTLSAALDGEDEITPTVRAHLDACVECRRFEVRAASLHRMARVAPAEPVPDLTASILAAIGEDSIRGQRSGEQHVAADRIRPLRIALFVVAAIQLVTSIPALLGFDAGLPVHAARHIGSFEVALAVGFFSAAWRPRRAVGMLPIIAALVVCLLASSIIDVASGTSPFAPESQHAIDLFGLGLVWLLTQAAATRRVVTT